MEYVYTYYVVIFSLLSRINEVLINVFVGGLDAKTTDAPSQRSIQAEDPR